MRTTIASTIIFSLLLAAPSMAQEVDLELSIDTAEGSTGIGIGSGSGRDIGGFDIGGFDIGGFDIGGFDIGGFDIDNNPNTDTVIGEVVGVNLSLKSEENVEYAGFQTMVQYDPAEVTFLYVEQIGDYEWLMFGEHPLTNDPDPFDGDLSVVGLANPMVGLPTSPATVAQIWFQVWTEKPCITISEPWCTWECPDASCCLESEVIRCHAITRNLLGF